ncbi:MFS transporter TsgA [Algiphilus sp. W345]|uniref:MFS transporter TsgA n=1 Tax=Banduia mediterranea TaxID=3075609 RepID=A0ABU2WJS2_9GAMM|nr:MFS transporter TsgA [Algiphilus sp. W345]MDT0498123.1 MFS transporter TsgA [Algiphilus sp. W345]
MRIRPTRMRWPDANLVRLTLGSFLCYFVLSGLISQIGAISGPMAQHFSRPLTEVAAHFSYLSSGVMFGTLLSLIYFEWSGLRKAFISCYCIAAAALLAIVLSSSWLLLAALLFIVGTVGGLGLSGGAVTLALSYTGRSQAVAMLCTDLCFALAGIVSAPTAAAFIAHGLPWNTSYIVLAVICALIVLLAWSSRYPPSVREINEPSRRERWPAAVWLCAAALFFYMLGQVSMLIWLPQHLEQHLQFAYAQSTGGISRYWTGMVIGQLTLVALLQGFKLKTLLPLIAISSVFGSCLVWTSSTAASVLTVTLLLGIANAGMLKLSLSFAATLVRHPQRVVTFLLFCGAAGQAISPYLSAQLVQRFDTYFCLRFVTFCYLAMATCICLAVPQKRNREAPNEAAPQFDTPGAQP